MDDDLVEQTLLDGLSGDAGAEQPDAPAAGRLLCARDCGVDRLVGELAGHPVRSIRRGAVRQHEIRAAPSTA
jgi:hypothetical protein